MNLCLFALTGFGNAIVAKLIELGIVDDIMVFTRKEAGEFPYYECENLVVYCRKAGIDVVEGVNANSLEAYEIVKDWSPEMILVGTFHQRIPKRIIEIPKIGAINIHPSLLPHYRGPTPTHWAIIHGEKETGITYHVLTEQIDAGDILLKRAISIGGLVDGELRRKLAGLAADMLDPFLTMYMSGNLLGSPQKMDEGRYFPKVTSKEGVMLLRSGGFPKESMQRGLTPYPGVTFLERCFDEFQK